MPPPANAGGLKQRKVKTAEPNGEDFVRIGLIGPNYKEEGFWLSTTRSAAACT